MVDRWGRPTFDDGMNIARSFMAVQDYGHRQKAYQEEELADKYFGMKVKGEDIPQGEGYNPKAELAADELMNRRWQAGQVKQIAETEEKLAKMPDEEALKFQPSNYAEHIVAAHRIKMIGSNEQNRQAIDELNNKKALESYQYSMAAFNEARDKYAKGDFKGASDNLVKIGMITNNPFKVRPSDDGKTVELYFTKDGVDQPGQKYPIDQAMAIAQQFLNGEEFFKAHLQNREARKQLNEQAILNPIILEKDGKSLRAIRQLDLNTNQVSWSVYDEKGKPYSDKPINDIGQLVKEGWARYDPKAEGEALKQTKTIYEIDKIRQQTEESKAKTEKARSEGPKAEGAKAWRNEWWPQLQGEKEGGDTPITEARAIVAKSFDNASMATKKLITGQILPEYKRWIEENKDQMVQGEDGQERPLNSQDLQNAFDHIAYNVIQRNAQKSDTGTKTEKGEGQTGAAAEGVDKTQGVTSAGTIEGVEVGVDAEGQPVVKEGKVWRAPKTKKEKLAVAKLANWRSKVKEDTGEYNPREPMRFN